MKKLLILLILAVIQNAFAADCQKTGSVCVDATPSKNISGVTVTLAQVGGCWQYTDTYNCIKPNSVDYCAGIAGTTGCYQTNATCIQTAFNGTCMKQTRTYRCGDPGLPTPTNTVRLTDSYTITQDTIDTSQCQTYSQNPLCVLAAHTCVEPGGTRIINGLPVTKDCWRWQDSYTCAGTSLINDCQALRDKGCTSTGSKCLTTNDSGSCTMYEQTYQCQTSPASTSTVMDCGTQTFCMSGNCFNSGHAPDTDFAKAISAMEAAREAGTYMDPNSLQLFKGFDNRCRKGYFGLKSCCKTSGGGATMNNASSLGPVIGSAVSAAGSVGGEALRYGSTYVYDALYASDSSSMLTQGMGAMLDLNGASTPTFDPTLSFGMYGMTWTSGVMAETTMGMANISLAAETGIQGLYFSPATFYIAIAVMVIQELMSCEQQEQVLGMKRGQNLCHFAGSYCSNKFLKICLETTESYCCFNSRLARIINEQGRGQVGKGWGSGESPDCGGFTPAQLQALDFSTMNLSEFYAEINPKMPDTNAVAAKNQLLIQQKVNSYYQQ